MARQTEEVLFILLTTCKQGNTPVEAVGPLRSVNLASREASIRELEAFGRVFDSAVNPKKQRFRVNPGFCEACS
jgi:hypothetical protein